MAQTRIKLKQIGEIWMSQQRSLFVPDNVRSGHIVPNFEQEPTPENWENGYDLIGKVEKKKIFIHPDSLKDIWENLDAYSEALPKRFKVLDFDESELGLVDTMEEGIELFLEVHPHFDKESIKTFIYDN